MFVLVQVQYISNSSKVVQALFKSKSNISKIKPATVTLFEYFSSANPIYHSESSKEVRVFPSPITMISLNEIAIYLNRMQWQCACFL